MIINSLSEVIWVQSLKIEYGKFLGTGKKVGAGGSFSLMGSMIDFTTEICLPFTLLFNTEQLLLVPGPLYLSS